MKTTWAHVFYPRITGCCPSLESKTKQRGAKIEQKNPFSSLITPALTLPSRRGGVRGGIGFTLAANCGDCDGCAAVRSATQLLLRVGLGARIITGSVSRRGRLRIGIVGFAGFPDRPRLKARVNSRRLCEYLEGQRGGSRNRGGVLGSLRSVERCTRLIQRERRELRELRGLGHGALSPRTDAAARRDARLALVFA